MRDCPCLGRDPCRGVPARQGNGLVTMAGVVVYIVPMVASVLGVG